MLPNGKNNVTDIVINTTSISLECTLLMKSPEMSISMINRAQELLKSGSAHANTLFLTKQVLLSFNKTFHGIKLHSEAVRWSDDRMQYGAGRYTDCMSSKHQHETHGVRNFARTSKKKLQWPLKCYSTLLR